MLRIFTDLLPVKNLNIQTKHFFKPLHRIISFKSTFF